jgi:hypothetical protein
MKQYMPLNDDVSTSVSSNSQMRRERERRNQVQSLDAPHYYGQHSSQTPQASNCKAMDLKNCNLPSISDKKLPVHYKISSHDYDKYDPPVENYEP